MCEQVWVCVCVYLHVFGGGVGTKNFKNIIKNCIQKAKTEKTHKTQNSKNTHKCRKTQETERIWIDFCYRETLNTYEFYAM